MDTAERQAKIDYIIEHYEHPHRYGALADATVVQKGGNPGCGDVLTVYMKVDREDRITDFSFEGEGCTISQAGASIISEMLEGKTLDEAGDVSTDTIMDLIGREIASTRLRCATLGLTTAREAIRTLQQRRAAAG